MSRGWDLILVGAGLANGLIAWRMRQLQPQRRVLLIEQGARPGGNHTWSFHEADLQPAQRQWLGPMIEHCWPGYTVRFPGLQRHLRGGYCSIGSAHFGQVLEATPGLQWLPHSVVTRISPDTVQLADGQTLAAAAVIDGRGALPSPHLQLAYQAFVGQEWQLPRPHGLRWPLLMDARVDQGEGYRFVYTLPLSADRLLIEDTHYVDTPWLDPQRLRENIGAYANDQGWQGGLLLREEHGCLPLTLSGQFDAFWASAQGVPHSGLRAGLFHSTTGYSLPCAVRLADEIARQTDLGHEHLFALVQGIARRHWRQQRFFRLLNRMLFLAGQPHDRWQVMQRFYGLPEGLIQRFYAGQPSMADKARLLMGKPPVPMGQALRAALKGSPQFKAPI
ncbi:lycopene beta-cyclase CrtY [Pseudomonas typographi]|uniref:lycopene beta-cyclase CrtY n=1 Tax=Pseudomonas typographi TaxID=2715964 RepID=UPI001682F9E2|nr:lycopene beta-cyclase CrtY [Pseudomonas typographi]MBD1551671.1 lycopene beta-cyclase CrtY [Pseudomonas typographi]